MTFWFLITRAVTLFKTAVEYQVNYATEYSLRHGRLYVTGLEVQMGSMV